MQETEQLMILALIALTVGGSVGLLVWLVSKLIVDVPPEDREYKDPPPLGFRLTWLLVQALAHYIDLLMSDRSRRIVLRKLMAAGLEFSLSPAQYQAGRLVCGMVTAGVFALVCSLFDQSGSITAGFYGQVAGLGVVLGWLYPALWLRDRIAVRKTELLKSLPFFLDMITLCVEAGLNLQGAMSQAVAKGPKGVLRSEFLRVLRDVRAGKQRAEALRAMSSRLREPAVTSFAQAVIQAEAMGMSLAPVLRAQADHRRSERFLRAEKKAMEAPVKMLFPLIAFIFPCTFLILFFPIVVKFMDSGI